MGKEFEYLAQALLKKDLSLKEYLEYLQLSSEKPYAALTKNLEKKSIALDYYLRYLEEITVPQTKATSVSQDSINVAHWISQIGGALLMQHKITLVDINSILEKIPQKDLTSKFFLQQLFRARKIEIEDFLSLGGFEPQDENSACPYQLKTENYPYQFYLNAKVDKKIGPFEILEELGRGGMGVVYKVYHSELNQVVALKMLLANHSLTDKNLKRFYREIQVMAKLNHPYLLQVYDSGEENGKHYFSMEYIPGEPLNLLLEKKTLREKLIIIQKVLEGLSEAHKNGVLHRDLKLSNILITPEGNPKIADFGLAQDRWGKNETKLTQTGALLGTPQYMAPEQAAGKIDSFDNRTDLYGVGVCLYKLLTKRFPHKGATLQQLLHKVIIQPVRAPSRFNPEIHPDIDAIVLKALEKEADFRYQRAEEFAIDIKRFLDGFPVNAKLAKPKERLVKWSKRNKLQIIIAMLLFLLVFGIWGSLFFIRKQEQEKEFQAVYKKAIQLLEQGKKSKKTQQLEFLFTGLNFLNQSLILSKEDRRAEKAKWELGNLLLKQAYKERLYSLAEYLIRELHTLVSIKKREKQYLKEQYQKEKKKIKDYQQTRFKFWVHFLKSGPFTEDEARDATFELSKMENIFPEIYHLVQEGNQWFLKQDYVTLEEKTQQGQFYTVMVKTIGRFENQKASKELWQGLEKITQNLIPLKGKRALEKVHYCISLAQALSQIKEVDSLGLFNDIRVKMGENSLFWNQTEYFYKKLLRSNQREPAKNETQKEKNSNYYLEKGHKKQFLEEYQAAIQNYNKALALNPKEITAYINRGIVKFLLKDYRGALQDYSTAITLEPHRATEAYNNRAMVKEVLGDLEGAVFDYSNALALSPKEATLYNNRGVVKMALKDYQGASADYKQALFLNPQYAETYTNRGNLQIELKKYQKAIDDFSIGIRLNPNSAKAYNNRGNAKRMIGKTKDAIKDYTQAILLVPQLPDPYYNRGISKFLLNDYEGAISDFTQTINLSPKHREAYSNRGLAKNKSLDYKGAILDFTKAISLGLSMPLLYYNRGVANKELKKDKAAIADFKKAIALRPDYFEAHFNIGVLRYQQKNMIQAKQHFAKFIQLTQQAISPQTKQFRKQIFKIFPSLKNIK